MPSISQTIASVGAAVSLLLSNPVAAADLTQKAADEFNITLRNYGETYYDLLVEANRCEQAIKLKSARSRAYCRSFEAAYQERVEAGRSVGKLCLTRLNDLVATKTANSDNGNEIAAACASAIQMTGTDRYHEVVKLAGSL